MVPNGKVRHDAFAVIRETIRNMDKVAIGRVVLTNREHIIALQPLEAADFEPEKFEDHYEAALTELINAKRNGKTIGPKPRPPGDNVVDPMDALKKGGPKI